MQDDQRVPWTYRLFGWWFRWQACKMAAVCVASWREVPDEGLMPKIWSTTVFFECYMYGGAAATASDFGPKDPAELKLVAKDAG
jgi:hypothetical protein